MSSPSVSDAPQPERQIAGKVSSATRAKLDVPIERLDVSAYRVPTDFPESDGTLAWDATTVVVVDLQGGGMKGMGFTYADEATARLIQLSTIPVDPSSKLRTR